MADDSTQIRQKRVQHKVCDPVLNISILHLGAALKIKSGPVAVSQPGLEGCSLNNCTISPLCAWACLGVR